MVTDAIGISWLGYVLWPSIGWYGNALGLGMFLNNSCFQY